VRRDGGQRRPSGAAHARRAHVEVQSKFETDRRDPQGFWCCVLRWWVDRHGSESASLEINQGSSVVIVAIDIFPFFYLVQSANVLSGLYNKNFLYPSKDVRDLLKFRLTCDAFLCTEVVCFYVLTCFVWKNFVCACVKRFLLCPNYMVQISRTTHDKL
jgi:hypothetical protein